MAKRRSIAEDLIQARAARATGAGGASGLLAVSLPLVFGGCVAVGYFAGAWLDARFKTGFWMPIGVVFGLAAGVREAFLTVKRLNASAKWPTKRDENEPLQNIAAQQAEREAAQRKAIENRPRPKLFDVPEPPQASFEAHRSSGVTNQPRDEAEEKPESVEEILRYLRDDDGEQLKSADEK